MSQPPDPGSRPAGYNRRDFICSGIAAAGITALAASLPSRGEDAHTHMDHPAQPPATPRPTGDYRPVVAPNGATLPWRVVDGVKVGHLIAEPVAHQFAPGLEADCWGYNGRTPGPVIEAVEGDRLRIYVSNRLPEATTVHWHGIILPSGMDGVGGLNQPPIMPGETYRYEFTVQHPGTFMYHPHADEMTQMGMGMMGMFIVHPRTPAVAVDRDYVFMLSEWAIHPGTRRPDTAVMNDFNILTLNSKAYPATAPIVAKTGERVRLRFGNLSAMDHHPIHLHGYAFTLTETDGGAVPPSAQHPDTTVLVPVGACKVVEFVAAHPGDWAMHCHMTHHIMNQMGHDIPNALGADFSGLPVRVRRQARGLMLMGENGMAGMGDHMQMMPHPDNTIPMLGGDGPHGYIDMGGMFTILKVRDDLAGDDDPGWYTAPPGTQARPATPAELAADGITPPTAGTPTLDDSHMHH